MSFYEEIHEFYDTGTIIEVRLIGDEDTVAGKIIKISDDSIHLQIYKVMTKAIKPLEVGVYYLDDIVEVVYQSATTQKIEKYLVAGIKAQMKEQFK